MTRKRIRHHPHRNNNNQRSSTAISSFLLLLALVGVLLCINFVRLSTSFDSDITTTVSSSSVRRAQLEPQSQEHQPGTSQSDEKKPNQYKPIPPRPAGIHKNLVKPGDFIYYKHEESHWDAAPVVVESHKLVFFTVPKAGCTVWKQLFRRMMGYPNWLEQNETTFLPHNPEVNGLKYLYDYSPEEASVMMTSPQWTRAVMVRDPKSRFLSAFLDKAMSNFHRHIIDRCCPDGECVNGALDVPGFLKLCQVCDDDHWRPQHRRIDDKYWPYMDMVLHVETAHKDAKALLQRIGAWDEFGATGWGTDGNKGSIFHSTEAAGAGEHATWAQWKVWKWYTPESEQLVERFYQCDYENPKLNFTAGECLTCIDPAIDSSSSSS